MLACIASCENGPFNPACTLELGMIYTPRDTTVAVGAQFYATIKLVGCGGRETLSDTFTWASSDSAVASVSPVPTVVGENPGWRALVTARAPGAAGLIPTGQRFQFLPGPMVTVQATP